MLLHEYTSYIIYCLASLHFKQPVNGNVPILLEFIFHSSGC